MPGLHPRKMMISKRTKHNDDRERERIVYGTEVDWDSARGGLKRIGPLSEHLDTGIGTDQLARLIQKGYVDPEDTQNGGPRMQKLLEFGDWVEDNFDTENITVRYTGYMISVDRPDSRVTITGIRIIYSDELTVPVKLENEFIGEFRRADEFERTDEYMRAWWD